MTVREYNETDNGQIFRLFFDTVHSINAKDYSPEQLNAWASEDTDVPLWCAPLLHDYALVAEQNNTIAGFGSMDNTGYFDRLYTHKNYQGQGIATGISDALEQYAKGSGISKVTAYVSITAKPFFEKRGYILICENKVQCGGQILINYKMEKYLLR